MTVTQVRERGRPRLRVLAAAAAGALALTGIGVVNASSANAAVLSATGGSLQWGLKASLLNYHINMHLGTTQGVTQGDGATASSGTRGSPESYPAYWNFPFVSGSFDSTTNSYTAQYGGFVALTETNPNASSGPGTASPFKYFKVSNPKVVIDLDNGTKQLVLDVQPGADTGPAEPSGPISEDVNFATFPSLTTEQAESGGTVTYSDLAAELTADGSAAFGGFYGAGTPVDPVSTSLSGLAAGPTPTPTPAPTPGAGQQSITVSIPEAPEECAGEIAWAISDGSDGTVSMTAAALAGDHLLSTGAIDPITISDSRTGDGAECHPAFAVSGQVTDFVGPNGTTIPGANLGWTPNATQAFITPGAAVASGFGGSGPGLSSPSTLATVSGGQPGSGDAGADLALQAPVESTPGAYEATLTLTGLT